MSVPSCPGCRERDERLAALELRVRQLEARLGKNASNSSLPPSANPPQAPPPVVKTPTGKKRGAQPGHPPLLRQRLPPQRVPKSSTSCPRPAAAAKPRCPPRPDPTIPNRPGIRSPNCPRARPDHRVPGPGPHLPLLRRGHPRRHPRRGPGLQHRHTPGGRPGLPDRPPIASVAAPSKRSSRWSSTSPWRWVRFAIWSAGGRGIGGGPRRGPASGAPGAGQARR